MTETQTCKWAGWCCSLNIYFFILFNSPVNTELCTQFCKKSPLGVNESCSGWSQGLCSVGADIFGGLGGQIWCPTVAGYIWLRCEMLVYICGALFEECKSIFGLLILMDSSKDANHAGRPSNVCDIMLGWKTTCKEKQRWRGTKRSRGQGRLVQVVGSGLSHDHNKGQS